MKRLIALGIFVGFLFFSVPIWAQVPQLLNYQGRLTDDVGIPIITSTTVRFGLYQGGDAATPGSGTLVYQEDASVTPDGNGAFNHLIGSGMVIYGTLDSTVFQTTDPVFLEITIDPAGANETLLPRKQIVTVGYSFKSELADDADAVDGQDAAAFAPVAHHHDPDYVNEGQADSVNSAMIVDGTIVDADINTAANIAASKINTTGLDADLLDGKDSLDFVHTAGDDMTGTLNVNAATQYALYGKTSYAMGTGVYGWAANTVGVNYGVYGISDSTLGRGVYGEAAATEGVTHGVVGLSKSTSGSGVYGYAEATSGSTNGVYGLSVSDNGKGVYGYTLNSSGTTYGVYGAIDSTSGYGVYGYAEATSGSNYGVFGKSASTSGYGVYGHATATEGITYGVYGKSDSASARGVYGYAAAASGYTYGVWGQSSSTNGRGVYGTAPTYGVHGYAYEPGGTTYGVYGKSDSTDGRGVYGLASATTGTTYGVYGLSSSPDGCGVYGRGTTNTGTGVYGEAPNFGVYGQATTTTGTTYGVYGISGSSGGHGVYGYAAATNGYNYGVFGRSNSASGYAGYFSGNAHVTGDFTVGGSKTCVQPIDNGKKVLLYAMESPEIWFEDFGTAQLVNGQAVVQLENVFTQAANTEIAYFVFPIPNGDCQGLYIARKDKDSFEVRELGDGTSNITFDYRIVAKRRGYEEVRFEEFTEPEQPPAEPNLPVEKK